LAASTTQNCRVVSGMRPTGPLHLGNYHGALANWIELQYRYECFFFVADWHALTTDYEDTAALKANVHEVIIDWLGAGLNPGACTIFVQSRIPEHAELHLILSMVTPVAWLERVPTYKDQMLQLNDKDLSTYGFLGYPLLQSADILMYRPEFVPVGEPNVALQTVAPGSSLEVSKATVNVDVNLARQISARVKLDFIDLYDRNPTSTDKTVDVDEVWVSFGTKRGSLEPLLINPAPRGAFVSGKWLAASLAAIASVILTTALSAQLTRFLPLEDIGIRLEISPQHIGNILLAVVPMCLFTAALQATIATLARSFKEAQSYMGVLMLAPLMPGLLSTLYPIGAAPWMYAVPLLGPYVLLTGVIGGRPPGVSAFLVSAGVSLLVAIILVRVTTHLFRSERIIFAR